jgi:hypothetical protein
MLVFSTDMIRDPIQHVIDIETWDSNTKRVISEKNIISQSMCLMTGWKPHKLIESNCMECLQLRYVTTAL